MQKIKDLAFNIRQKYSYEPEEKVLKLFDQVGHINGVVIPIKLLDEISECSFDIHDYTVLIPIILKRLNTQFYAPKQTLKTLTIVDYLMKYGCSACIDDFKEWLPIFQNYAEYMTDNNTNVNQIIRDKSNHIYQLLLNRDRLYNEKHLAKQIKMKIHLNRWRFQAIQGKYVGSQKQPTPSEQQSQSAKLEDFAENYIFKYLDKFNDKLESWGDKINDKIDGLIEKLGIQEGIPNNDEEFVFPESCLEDSDIQPTSKDAAQLEFRQSKIDQQSLRPPPPPPPPKQPTHDLMQFEESPPKKPHYEGMSLIDL